MALEVLDEVKDTGDPKEKFDDIKHAEAGNMLGRFGGAANEEVNRGKIGEIALEGVL